MTIQASELSGAVSLCHAGKQDNKTKGEISTNN